MVYATPDPVSIQWKVNGREIPGATDARLTLRGLRMEDAGDYSVEVSTPCRSESRTAKLNLRGEGLQNPAVVSNPNRLVIQDFASVTAPIDVRCIPGILTNITVSVYGFFHTFPSDVDMVLVSPNGKAIKLMSDVLQDSVTISNVSLTFSDSADGFLPRSVSFASGTYRPTDYTDDDLGEAAGGTNLAGLYGSGVNGTWSLRIVDDATHDTGRIDDGWSMTMAWEDNAPHLSLPLVLADGRVQLSLTSHANQTHLIEGSYDLENWFPVSTNSMVATNITIVVPAPLNRGQCFYRVVRCPCISPGCFSCIAQLSAPALLQDGRFRMILNSAAGKTHVIESSSDLINWVPVSTNTLNAATMPVIMPRATNLTHRFYRAIRCQ